MEIIGADGVGTSTRSVPEDTLERNLASVVVELGAIVDNLPVLLGGYVISEISASLGVTGDGKVGLLGVGASSETNPSLVVKVAGPSSDGVPSTRNLASGTAAAW